MARTFASFAILGAALLAGSAAHAMTLSGDPNIVDLLQQSNDIVVGHVASVTDGIDDHGVPYTEVTLNVTESIRGAISGQYKFRQFGLLAPRLTADGKRKMMPAPEGFPRYTAGEDLALMLRPSARLTGFRMPAGVTRGKFRLTPGRAENEDGNTGLFHNVHIEKGLATASDSRMMAASGPANPENFLSFLRHAVHGRWVETGKLRSSNATGLPATPPPSEPNGAPGNTAPAPGAPKPPAGPAGPTTNVGIGRSGR